MSYKKPKCIIPFEGLRGAPKKTSIKIALIGDGAVGKTSFFDRITTGDHLDYKFKKSYEATTGCNICQTEFSIGKYFVKLHLFDTAGQEKFGALRDSYLMGVDGVILMYDLENKETRQNVLTRWLPDLKRIQNESDVKSYVPVAVVGNKSDRIDTNIVKRERLYLDTVNYRTMVGIRKSVLSGHYDGTIEHFYASVKAEEDLIDPINWLLKDILWYYLPVDAKKISKTPIVVRPH